MRAGYVWDFGPFEYWDLVGFQQGVHMIEAAGEKIPDWIKQMQNAGAEQFYKYEKGEKNTLIWTVKPTKQYPDLTPVSFWKVSVKVLL